MVKAIQNTVLLTLIAGLFACGTQKANVSQLQATGQLYTETKKFPFTYCTKYTDNNITVDSESITLESKFFYNRGTTIYRLSLKDDTLYHYHQADAVMSTVPPTEETLSPSQEGYDEGVKEIQKILSHIVNGYACWQPRAEAKPALDYVSGLVK
jgi:hypothetical protein